jgi:glycosyltransferase involved in cell wall biosynthesis
VFTLGSSQQDESDAQALKDRCKGVHYYDLPLWHSLWNSGLALPSQRPLQSVYSWHSRMANDLANRLAYRHFDLVHVEHLRGSRYATFIKSRFPEMAVVWDSVDCISHLFQQAAGRSTSLFGRFVTYFELARTRNAEGNLICDFDHVLVTSAADRHALLGLACKGREPSPVSVLRNGVNLEYFHPNPDVPRDPATILFSGKMSYHANITMVKHLVTDIMPRVWKACPQTRLVIVGKDPSSEIRKLDRKPFVTVTGTVADLRPFLWRATLSVVPLLYGAGIQNKILEAMATATPVVTSPQALSALQAQPGKDLLVANDPTGFAQNILKLLNDQHFQRVVGDSGLSYVRKNHNWKAIASQLAKIYQDTLDHRQVVDKGYQQVPV